VEFSVESLQYSFAKDAVRYRTNISYRYLSNSEIAFTYVWLETLYSPGTEILKHDSKHLSDFDGMAASLNESLRTGGRTVACRQSAAK
jgi:hypothetical protein